MVLPASIKEIGDYAFSYSVIYDQISAAGKPDIVGEHAFQKALYVDNPVKVENILLSENAVSINPGTTHGLYAKVFPFYAPDKSLRWETSNSEVADVDQNEIVTGIKAGKAIITVTTEDSGFTDTCHITVVQQVMGITISKNINEVTEGASFSLVAAVEPDNSTNKNVTWSSSDSKIATVDATGKVTAVKAGTATIIAASEDGGHKASCVVTVKEKAVAVEKVSLSRTTYEITEGNSFTLTAIISPDNATNKNMSWRSSNSGVATVNQNGVVKAIKTGTANITVTTADGKKTAVCSVSVKAKDLKSEFIKRLYRTCLDREADVGGLNYWKERIESGDLKGIGLAGSFVFSGEFTSKNYCNEHFVAQIYPALMGREPDAGGLAFWTESLDAGMTREEMLNRFTASTEYRSLCTKAGIELGPQIRTTKYGTKPYGACAVCGEKTKVVQFVERMYKECMGRGADAGGLKYWSKALYEHTKTGRDLTRGFVLSAEMRNKKLSNSEYIQAIYRVMLGREADKGGLAFWEEQMKKGKTLADIIEGFVNSREFTGICDDYGIQRK